MAPHHIASVPAASNQPGESVARATREAAAASSAASSAAVAASQAANAASVASAAAASAAHAAQAASTSTKGAAESTAGATTATMRSATKQVPALQPSSSSSGAWWWYVFQKHFPQLAEILQDITFAIIIKVMCMAGNVLVQVSPYPQVMLWEKHKCTGDADAAPYVSIAFGGWQWCAYGTFAWLLTKRSGFLILVHSNCLGALLGTYYAITFYRHCKDPSALSSFQRYLSAVMSLVVLQICTVFVLPAERALFLTGLVSSFCSFVGALSMLVTLPVVVRTKDSSSIPTPLVLANLLSSCVWCVCGWMLQDLLVSGPNVVAAIASITCLYLKKLYPAKLPESDDESRQDFGLAPAKQSVRSVLNSVRLPSAAPPKSLRPAASPVVREPSPPAPVSACVSTDRAEESNAPAQPEASAEVAADAADAEPPSPRQLLQPSFSAVLAAVLTDAASPPPKDLKDPDCECGTGGTW